MHKLIPNVCFYAAIVSIILAVICSFYDNISWTIILGSSGVAWTIAMASWHTVFKSEKEIVEEIVE